MEQCFISGTLLYDAEKCVNVNGTPYVRFTVTCGDEDFDGRTQFTHYMCTTYSMNAARFKKGDQVIVSGHQKIRKIRDEKGNVTDVRISVIVYQVSAGYTAAEKKLRK